MEAEAPGSEGDLVARPRRRVKSDRMVAGTVVLLGGAVVIGCAPRS